MRRCINVQQLSWATGELGGSRDWLTVFQLPPYASELNAARLRLMQHRPGLIAGFLTGTRPGLTSLQ